MPDFFSDLDSVTRSHLDEVATELDIDIHLPVEELVAAIAATPGGERLLVGADHTLNRGLRMLFEGLARERGYVDHGEDWIEFLAADTHVVASVKGGFTGVLSLDAHLLDDDRRSATPDDVVSWLRHQPPPALGLLLPGEIERDGGTAYGPVLSLDFQMDGVMCEFVAELIAPYAEAWSTRSVASPGDPKFGPGGYPYRLIDAETVEPENAWLLMATESAHMTTERLVECRAAASGGVYDLMWTAPKNGQVGDLCLIYFAAPRKAVHFVARLASRPFWRTEGAVAPDKEVDRHQWWAWLTPPIEIEPVGLNALRAAAGGYLTLRGRSGRYISSSVISQLTMMAVDPDQQAHVERVVQLPAGLPALPDPDETSLDVWREIPGALLMLEAKVSEHIVTPLLRLLREVPSTLEEPPIVELLAEARVVPEYRVGSGYVDFVVAYGNPSTPALAVEVKLAVVDPPTGVWADSADFRQLVRYMDGLGTPGLLVDLYRVFLVRPGASAPFREIVRAEATWDDVAAIRDLLLGGAR